MRSEHPGLVFLPYFLLYSDIVNEEQPAAEFPQTVLLVWGMSDFPAVDHNWMTLAEEGVNVQHFAEHC